MADKFSPTIMPTPMQRFWLCILAALLGIIIASSI